MTAKEFVEFFGRLLKERPVRWYLSAGAIRQKGTKHCPLSFAGHAILRNVNPCATQRAADLLSVNAEDRAALIDAADGTNNAIRRGLLKAAGL